MNILTFDYELFGNGKGDIYKHLIEPTQKILKTLKKERIKATFFLEIIEIDAILTWCATEPEHSLEFNQASDLKRQIGQIINDGHDIQLHVHPQWINAEYTQGKWLLNLDLWRFSSLPDTNQSSTPSKSLVIERSKKSLECLIKQFNPSYTCIAFRAGGYNIGSGKASLDALIGNEIFVDSSVCPGYFASTSLSNYDFTDAPADSTHWGSTSSLNTPQNTSEAGRYCLELPITCINSSLLERVSLPRLFSAIRNYKYKKTPKTALPSQPKFPNNIQNSNFDVCLSSTLQLKKFRAKICAFIRPKEQYVVMIGHPKDYSFFSPLRKIIKRHKTQGVFLTVRQFYEKEYNIQQSKNDLANPC